MSEFRLPWSICELDGTVIQEIVGGSAALDFAQQLEKPVVMRHPEKDEDWIVQGASLRRRARWNNRRRLWEPRTLT